MTVMIAVRPLEGLWSPGGGYGLRRHDETGMAPLQPDRKEIDLPNKLSKAVSL